MNYVLCPLGCIKPRKYFSRFSRTENQRPSRFSLQSAAESSIGCVTSPRHTRIELVSLPRQRCVSITITSSEEKFAIVYLLLSPYDKCSSFMSIFATEALIFVEFVCLFVVVWVFLFCFCFVWLVFLVFFVCVRVFFEGVFRGLLVFLCGVLFVYLGFFLFCFFLLGFWCMGVLRWGFSGGGGWFLFC